VYPDWGGIADTEEDLGEQGSSPAADRALVAYESSGGESPSRPRARKPMRVESDSGATESDRGAPASDTSVTAAPLGKARFGTGSSPDPDEMEVDRAPAAPGPLDRSEAGGASVTSGGEDSGRPARLAATGRRAAGGTWQQLQSTDGTLDAVSAVVTNLVLFFPVLACERCRAGTRECWVVPRESGIGGYWACDACNTGRKRCSLVRGSTGEDSSRPSNKRSE
jgi:hypothetical protein